MTNMTTTITQPSDATLNPFQQDSADLRAFANHADAEAFARLTRRHLDMVYTFCRRQLRDAHLAEDVTQAVFILLSQKAKSIDVKRGLTGWLFEASRYCCSNARRMSQRRTRHEIEAAKLRPTNVEHHEQSIDNDEIGPAVQNALLQMKPKDRDIILLRYFQQRSHREVGEMLGVSEEAAKHRVVRAMSKLKAIVSKDGLLAPASAAALPLWLESHSLLTAPSSLMTSATTATAGPAAIAKAAGATMHTASIVTKIKLAAGVAALVTAGIAAPFAVKMVMQAQPAPAPQVAAVPTVPIIPATVPTTQTAKAEIDLTTPITALRSLSNAMKALDLDAARNCQALPDTDEAKMVMAALRMEMSQIRLQRTMRRVFGPDIPVVSFTGDTTDVTIDQTLKLLQPDDLKMDGDHATIALRFPQEQLDRNPELRVMEGSPLPFVHGPAGWKLDVLDLLVWVQIDRTNGITKANPIDAKQFYDTITDLAEAMNAEIEAGRITDAGPLKQQFGRDLDTLLQERKVPVNRTKSLPKSIYEQMMKEQAERNGAKP